MNTSTDNVTRNSRMDNTLSNGHNTSRNKRLLQWLLVLVVISMLGYLGYIGFTHLRPNQQAVVEDTATDVASEVNRQTSIAAERAAEAGAATSEAARDAASGIKNRVEETATDVAKEVNRQTSRLAGDASTARTVLDRNLNRLSIHFASNSQTITPKDKILLDESADFIKSAPVNTTIAINGYTDNTGDPNTNLKLSIARANMVRDELIKRGVNPSMLIANGYGDSNPVADNGAAEGRNQNRRIEFKVVK